MTDQRRPLLVACACLLAFVALAVLVGVDSPVASLDRAIRDALLRHPGRPLLGAATTFVDVFSPLTDALALTAGAGIFVWRRGRFAPVIAVAVTGWLMAAVVLGTKYAVGRPPPVPVAAGHGGSFPSGHTAAAVVCLGALALLIAIERPRWAWPMLVAVGAVTLAVAAALVYANFHWFFDTVGSVALGIGLLVPLRWWLSRKA